MSRVIATNAVKRAEIAVAAKARGLFACQWSCHESYEQKHTIRFPIVGDQSQTRNE